MQTIDPDRAPVELCGLWRSPTCLQTTQLWPIRRRGEEKCRIFKYMQAALGRLRSRNTPKWSSSIYEMVVFRNELPVRLVERASPQMSMMPPLSRFSRIMR